IAAPSTITEGGPALSQALTGVQSVAVDKTTGNIYIPVGARHRVFKVATDGTMTTFAGTGMAGDGGDGGPATAANLDYPTSVVLDAAGNLYITDQNNSKVRKVAVDGKITTI